MSGTETAAEVVPHRRDVRCINRLVRHGMARPTRIRARGGRIVTRQFCSPKRVTCALVLLAALVVGGLAYVSVAALGVEAAQRESVARTDAVVRERFALWRLDGFVLPVLGLENNRPYSHYFALSAPSAVALNAAGDPTADPGRIPSPLLTADLPPWMTLHFQLDPERGWESPQVIPTGLANRLNAEPFGLFLTNYTDGRSAQLGHLRATFPAAAAARALASQEQAEPDEPPYLVPVPQADDPILDKPAPLLRPDDPPGWSKPAAGELVAVGRGGTWCDVPEIQVARRPEPESAKKAEERAAPPLVADLARQQQLNLNPRAPEPRTESGRDAMARKYSTDNVLQNRAGYEPGGKLQGFPAPPGRGVNPANPPELKATIPAADEKNLEKQAAEWTEYLRNGVVRLKELRDLEQQAKDAPPAEAKKGAERARRPSDALVEQRGRRRANDYVALAKEGGPQPPAGEAKAGPLVVPVAVHLGPIRPRWLTVPDGSRLLVLVRAAKLNEKTVYQGVVLDWPALKGELLARVSDLLPVADLTPEPFALDAPPEHSMSALPVRLDGGAAVELPPAGWTPLRSGLVLAWAAALLAITAVAFGGRAVVAMSERRVRFASAVTHELRTPLTAMQLHLDLLNSGLVTDEAKKAEYLATLTAEADRLNRLVENVLDFAKLEKQSARAAAQRVPVVSVLDAVRVTWTDRLAADGFELIVEAETPAEAAVVADPRVIAQVLGNLIDNARKYAKAAADRRVLVRATAVGTRIALTVEDRGPGVPANERATVFRPFSRGSDTADSGGAGLGLSLARQWAELYGGTLSYRPAADVGARFVLELPGV